MSVHQHHVTMAVSVLICLGVLCAIAPVMGMKGPRVLSVGFLLFYLLYLRSDENGNGRAVILES